MSELNKISSIRYYTIEIYGSGSIRWETLSIRWETLSVSFSDYQYAKIQYEDQKVRTPDLRLRLVEHTILDQSEQE